MDIDIYVGLKSKTYAFVTEDNYECRITKNINENIINDEVKYEHYKNIWYNIYKVWKKENSMQRSWYRNL